MHRSLKVPEILCLIFKCDLTERYLLNCALVCQLWGIWAQDVLWRTRRVPLQEVLQLLYPVEKTSVICCGKDIVSPYLITIRYIISIRLDLFEPPSL